MWTNDKVLKLIKDYQAAICLWDVTSPDYKNREKKREALESLAAQHNVLRGDLEKKIHNLKTSFNRERKRIESTAKKSQWFAYKHMLFLQPANVSSRNRDVVDTENGNMKEEVFSLDTADTQEQKEADVDAEFEEDNPPCKMPRYSPESNRNNTQAGVSCPKTPPEVLAIRDEHSIFGEYVACKMRNCNKSRTEISLAQRYINDILFRLDMGQLGAEIPTNQMSHSLSAPNSSGTPQNL